MAGVEIKKREQCPSCAADGLDSAKDNLSIYKDGKFCQSCGYVEKTEKKEKCTPLVAGAAIPLLDRRLTLATCEKYNIRTTLYTGRLNGEDVVKEPLRIFPYYAAGQVVKQKLKSALDKKKQTQKGDTSNRALFGQNLFTPSDKIPIVVTEGEEDAAAVWQMTGLPAVSIPNGAGNAAKDIGIHLEYLSSFREVLLAFDTDEKGLEAFTACVGLFEPGKAKKVNFPLKDANDMLLAGRAEEVKKCFWNAEVIKPATIVFPNEVRAKVLKQPMSGADYPWPSMTKATYGMRRGEVILLAAPTSTGKTEFVMSIIRWLISSGCKVGNFSFEQSPEQTLQRMIGAQLNQRLHVPGGDAWDEVKIQEELDKLQDFIALYQPESGHISIENVLINIRYLAKAHDMRFFVIDNLKAMAAHPIIDGKRVATHDYASHCMSLIVLIAKQLNVTILVVNHLSVDKISKQAYVSTSPKDPETYFGTTAEDMQKMISRPGMDWETGRMPTIDNIFGGGAIKDLTDYIIVLARNRMSDDDEEHRTTIVKFLKTRLDSQFEGFTFKLRYDYETGRLEEVGAKQAVKEIPNILE